MRKLLLLALVLPSCASPLSYFGGGYTPGCMTVDVSAKKAVVAGRAIPIVTAFRGTGGKPGSKRTPLTSPDRPLVVIAKHPHHRLGPSLRLGGVSADGYPQDGRGILIHRAYGTGTRGCIGIPPEQMRFIFASLDVGDAVRIMP